MPNTEDKPMPLIKIGKIVPKKPVPVPIPIPYEEPQPAKEQALTEASSIAPSHTLAKVAAIAAAFAATDKPYGFYKVPSIITAKEKKHKKIKNRIAKKSRAYNRRKK